MHRGWSQLTRRAALVATLALGFLISACAEEEGSSSPDWSPPADARASDGLLASDLSGRDPDGRADAPPLHDGSPSSEASPPADAARDTSKPSSPSWDEKDPPLKDPQRAKTYCDKALSSFNASGYSYAMGKAAGGDLNDLYHLARLFHGMILVYEVTGDVAMLGKLLDIAGKVIAAGKDLGTPDGYKDYCSSLLSPSCDSDPNAKCTYPWRAMRGLARVLRAVKGSSLAQSRSAEVKALETFVQHDVIDKWLDLDGTGPDKGKLGTDTVGIQVRMLGILIDYHVATKDVKVQPLVKSFLDSVMKALKLPANLGGAYFTNNWLTKTGGTAGDTSHVNEIVEAVVEAFKAGLLPYSQVAPFQLNFVKRIWNGNSTSPKFNHLMDGSSSTWEDAGTAALTMGFMRLGQFQRASQDLAERAKFSTSNILENLEGNGTLCSNFGLALKSYP